MKIDISKLEIFRLMDNSYEARLYDSDRHYYHLIATFKNKEYAEDYLNAMMVRDKINKLSDRY